MGEICYQMDQIYYQGSDPILLSLYVHVCFNDYTKLCLLTDGGYHYQGVTREGKLGFYPLLPP